MEKEWMLSVPCSLCVGKYNVEQVIGDTDRGITYKAVQAAQSVCLLAYKPAGDETEQQAALKRFREDAETLRKFSHANIVKVLDIFEESGVTYVVLPWLEGRTHAAVRKAKIAFGPYQPAVDKTKEYIRTLNIDEECLPKKSHFLFLPDWKVLLVGFGAVQIYDNSLLEEEDFEPEAELQVESELKVESEPQPNIVTTRPASRGVSVDTRQSPVTPISQEPLSHVTAQGRPVRQAAQACSKCKRPLPICRCQQKGNRH